MEPIHYDGPSIEPGVKRRLRRLDRQLRVTFSPYSLDTFTGYPILMNGMNEDGYYLRGPAKDPAHYLWRKDPCSSHHFFVMSYSVHTGGFGHLQVRHLEGDIARHLSPEHAWRAVKEATDRNLARKAVHHKQYLRDKTVANKDLAWDIVNGKHVTRSAKVMSYSGVGSRLSSYEKGEVRLDNRELGVEE